MNNIQDNQEIRDLLIRFFGLRQHYKDKYELTLTSSCQFSVKLFESNPISALEEAIKRIVSETNAHMKLSLEFLEEERKRMV